MTALKKLKAGALQSTLFISVVIAILLASFILLIHLHKRFDNQTDFIKESVENANLGIDYVLVNTISSHDSIDIDLKDEDYKSLLIHKDNWGVFEKVLSTAQIKTNSSKQIALIGASQPKNNRIALHLEDRNKPLVLVGNSRIQGLAYLPKQGVKSGNIAGHSYYGSQLIYGEVRTSNMLPKLSKDVLNSFSNHEINNKNYFLDIRKDREHSNSFFSPVQQIYSTNTIVLAELKLTGHIQVISETKIIVDPTSILNDIVLIAPEIEIKDFVHGTFQCLATKKISVGKNCILNYPSALILKTKESMTPPDNTNEISEIIIENNSIVNGIVVFEGKKIGNNYRPQIVIEEKAIVKGEVYCNSNLELRGSVFGSVFTSNFVANQSGSIYQNHIYNGSIIIDELPSQYVGLEFENSNKGVVKWLY